MARRNGQNPRPWTPLQPATYKTPEDHIGATGVALRPWKELIR